VADVADRGDGGRWLPGKCPNPGGRPGGIAEVRRWAQGVWEEHGRDALLNLALHGKREEIRLRAWQEILDRAYGRSPQALIHTGAEGGPLAFEPAGALVARLTALIGEGRGEPAALPAAVELTPGIDDGRAP
jgi:hypothetical protein